MQTEKGTTVEVEETTKADVLVAPTFQLRAWGVDSNTGRPIRFAVDLTLSELMELEAEVTAAIDGVGVNREQLEEDRKNEALRTMIREEVDRALANQPPSILTIMDQFFGPQRPFITPDDMRKGPQS